MLLKTQLFEEQAFFSVIKNNLALFSSLIEYDKRQGTTYKGSQGIVTSDKFGASYIIVF